MLLTEYWRRRVAKSNEIPPGDSRRLGGIFVPPEDFSAMVEEHNVVRELHGQARVRERDALEIRIHGVIVKRLELMPARGRKERGPNPAPGPQAKMWGSPMGGQFWNGNGG